MNILGIETSCDETGVAIYNPNAGIIANQLYSQISLHQPHGGVVPELASRDHIRKLIPLVEAALAEAQLRLEDINCIGYTAGPGLIGALLVGATFGRTLAYARNIPVLPIHHLEAHFLIPLLETPAPEFPFVALLVSGGHTLLMQVNSLGNYEKLGETMDDAAGEAFDKTAKLLGLGYPGGKALAELAQQSTAEHLHFPRPMTERPGMDFSFSGLKTAVAQAWTQSAQDAHTRADMAYAFQAAVVDTLVIKCKRALQHTGLKQLVVAGGVSANSLLREKLGAMAATIETKVFYPQLAYCTDNGAMIAYATYLHFAHGEQQTDLSISVRARWPLTVS